jgi:acyl-CoA synthetase (AMP-forming)/AMP-acid ligase II
MNYAGIEDRLTTFCKARLAQHLVPKQIVALKALPKNNAGKVLKKALPTA